MCKNGGLLNVRSLQLLMFEESKFIGTTYIKFLSDNIFRIAPSQLRDVKVDATIMGGKVVYSA